MGFATLVTTASAGVHPIHDSKKGPGDILERQHPHQIEYCPDNTCDSFEARAGVSKNKLRDFAFLYLFAASDYIYLEKWRLREEVRSAVETLVSAKCRNVSPLSAAECGLSEMLRTTRIDVYAVRFDENRRVKTRLHWPRSKPTP